MKLILTWTLALSLALYLVKGVKIGPVIFTISQSHAMGVHAGDFLAFIPLALALIYTVRRRSQIDPA